MIKRIVFLGTFLLHAATAWRYGYFRDELYFIACAKHLAWGYVDQPPLVAIAAWLSAPFGYTLEALRFLPMLSAALAAVVAIQIAKDLGGGKYAQWLAGISVALLPAYLLLGNILTTTSFESLSWTLVIWCCIKLCHPELVEGRTNLRWWLLLAASLAFGLYGKYSIALLAVALVIGLIATRERRILASWWFPLTTVFTFILVAPNLWWQAAHGWPMIDVLRGDAAHRHAFNTGLQLEYQNLWANTIAYASEQALYTNPVAVPLWIAGLIAPFTSPALRRLRFVSIAYVALFIAAVALEAKGYYTIGVYAALLAIGAVALERAFVTLAQRHRLVTLSLSKGYVALLAVVAVATLPLSLPILPINGFIAYSAALGLTDRRAPRLVQPVYAEEFGWDRLAADVAQAYNALPASQRARTAIYTDTYADAGAIDFFGTRYGLPSAISSQNTYWLWGTRGYDGSTLIAIGATRIDSLRRYYRTVKLLGTSNEPLKWAVEGPAPIYLCADPTKPLDEIWASLRWYGA